MTRSASRSVVDDDGAEMKDRVEPLRMLGEEGHQRLGRDQRRQFALSQIAPFVAVAEPVADDEIGSPALFERGDEIRADEAGAAGDEDHRSL